MTVLQAFILGIIQGLTEFLPVSSSAHLVLIPHLLGWNLSEDFVFPFDVLVQLGTLVAVIVFFWADLKEIFFAVIRGIRARKPFLEAPARVGWLAILATLPAGILGLLIKDKVEAAFNSPAATAAFLFVTAGLLIASEFLGKCSRDLEEITWRDALWVGAFQAFAIFPGISRSGSTIAGGMTRDFRRKPAGEFSFILAIPVFLAAGFLGIRDLLAINNLYAFLPAMLVGFITAGIVGYFAIRWLLNYLAGHSLLPFAGYCVMLAVGTLAFTFLNPGMPSQTVNPAARIKGVTASSESIFIVALEPDLEWLLPAMVDCQKDQDLTFLFNQTAFETGKPLAASLALSYGEISIPDADVFQLGSESLTVCVHPANPLQVLAPDLADGIFSGRIRTWEEAVQICADCFSASDMAGDIDLYAFTPESVIYESTRNGLSGGKPLSSAARLAPDAKAIRQALSQDPQALAALPASWVDATIKTVVVETENVDLSSIPILAYAVNPLGEVQKNWLSCVQNSIK